MKIRLKGSKKYLVVEILCNWEPYSDSSEFLRMYTGREGDSAMLARVGGVPKAWNLGVSRGLFPVGGSCCEEALACCWMTTEDGMVAEGAALMWRCLTRFLDMVFFLVEELFILVSVCIV